MSDVVYMLNKKHNQYVFKAMNENAKTVMRKFLDFPPRLDGETFLHIDGTPSGLHFLRTALEAEGLSVEEHGVEKPKPVDIRALTEF